jgi:hypothetical protein
VPDEHWQLDQDERDDRKRHVGHDVLQPRPRTEIVKADGSDPAGREIPGAHGNQ